MTDGAPTMNPHMFRAYDIRGLAEPYGTDLTPAISRLIGRAWGTWLRRRSGSSVVGGPSLIGDSSVAVNASMVVGGDMRPHTPALKGAFVEGALATGCDVIDIGEATSPLMYFAVIDRKTSGGVNITASHNPVEYNGIKMVEREAFPLAEEEIAEVRDLAIARDFEHGRGALSTWDPTPAYYDTVASLVTLARPMKVVVDTGNGVAGLFVPTMLRRLGCDVVELYTDPDPTFPNHLPDPEKEENMRDLMALVPRVGAEVGLAWDGDGDRLGLCDECGDRWNADFVNILLARSVLQTRPGAEILIDIKSSMAVLNEITRCGGRPRLWRTGPPQLKREMYVHKQPFGAEFSGHVVVADGYYPVDDALVGAAHVLAILSRTEMPLSRQFDDIPNYVSTNLAYFTCPDDQKFDIVDDVRNRLADRYPITDIDGVRADFGTGWGLVRASNTSPALTLRCEATSETEVERIIAELFAILRLHPSVDLDSGHLVIGAH
jgi:phosphomannomutase/phosphoglucomutase